MRLLIPSTRHMEQSQGGDALLHAWPEGVPSSPAPPVTRSWLEPQQSKPPSLRGHLWFGACGLSGQRCPRWTSGSEPVTLGRCTCPAFSSVPRKGPTVFSETALWGNSAPCFLIAKQLEKNQ